MAEYRYELRGEIDLAAVPKLRTELRQAIDDGHAHIVVDCTGLRFLDSAGVAALLQAHQMLSHGGRRMSIVNVGPFPRRTFEMLGVTDLLSCNRDSQPA